MVGALWIDSGSDTDTDPHPHPRRSRRSSHGVRTAITSTAQPGPSRLRTSPRQKHPRSPGSTSVIVLSSSQDHDGRTAATAQTRLPSTCQDAQDTPTKLTHSQGMAGLMSQQSPDSSLPSFRELITRHTSGAAAPELETSSRCNGGTAGAPSSRILPVSTRAGSLRRTASQPAASSSQEDPPPSHRVRSARTPMRGTRTSTVHEVIEIGSDPINDPASEAQPLHSPNSSPIRSQFSARHLPSSSLPLPVSPVRNRQQDTLVETAASSAFERPITARSIRSAGLHTSRAAFRTESAPIVILSSSPPPPSLPRASQSDAHPVHMDDDLGFDFPPSSLPFEAFALPSPPSSPYIGPSPEHDKSPSMPKRTAPSTSKLPSPKRARPLNRTRSLLDALDQLYVPDTRAGPVEPAKAADAAHAEVAVADAPRRDGGGDAGASRPKETSKAARLAAAKEAREAKARDREAAKAAKARAAAEKKRFVEANRLRTSKADTMRELIVDLDRTLFAAGQPLATCQESITARLEQEGATVHLCDGVVAPPLVRFRRKVRAEWSDEKRHWVPLDEEEVRREAVTIVYVDAAEVVRLVGEGEETLEVWYLDLLRRLDAVNQHKSSRGREKEQQQVFLICQGLVKFYARRRANVNRAYTARIRQQLAEGSAASTAAEVGGDAEAATGARARKGGAAQAGEEEVVAQAVVERALLQLKMMRRCYVIHAASLVDGVEWVHQLTADVSLRPYKALRDTHLSFAVDTGRNTTCGDSAGIYAMMLQQIPRVTPAIAATITTLYPSLSALVAAYEACASHEEQKRLLATAQIQSNRDGTVRSANRASLGLQLSKRIHAVMRGTNAETLINHPSKD